MTQRSIWSEGIFGQIKEDNHYDKLRRRSISGVKLEILLVCIGHNLRRYHTRKLEFQKNNKMKRKELNSISNKNYLFVMAPF